MNQEKKRKLAPLIKEVLKKYKMKGSLSVNNHMELVITIRSGVIDFGTDRETVNEYWIDSNYDGIAKEFLQELRHAMMVGNHNNSDAMTDYFDVGWYIGIKIGDYGKPYILS